MLFIYCGWAIGSFIADIVFPKVNNIKTQHKQLPTIINNYKTEQHLHISKSDLKELLNNKKA